jgi:PAS domain S-box-containing protein
MQESRIQDKRGEYLWLREQGSGFEVDKSSGIVGIVGTHRVIHEEDTLLAKNRLQPLLEYGRYFVWEVDVNGHFTYLNKHVERLLGYRVDELLGKRIIDLMPKLEAKRLLPFYQEVFKHKERINDLMNVKLNREGKSLYFLSAASAFFDENGAFMGYRGIDRDISEEIHLEQELKKQKIILNQREEELSLAHTNLVTKAQQEAFRTKAQFLANMSEDIRNPMSDIIALAHYALEGEIHPQKREPLEKIELSARALLEVIKDILDISKIEVGELTIEPHDFDLLKSIDEMMRFLDMSAQAKGLIIDISYGREVKRYYHGDSMRLVQVLTNLLLNAIKCSDYGTIELFIDRIDSTKLRFEVRDSGMGIAQESEENLFPSLDKIDSLSSLGRAISKHLVEMMGGSIWCESQLGEGSTFIFEVQLEEGEELLIEEESEKELLEDLKNALHTLKGSHILIAESDFSTQEMIKGTLKHSGIVIDIAQNGAEALKMYQDRPTRYELMLINLKLPILNGFEAIKQIRASGAQMPIIALIERGDTYKNYEIDVNDYLIQPIEITKLYKSLLKHIFSKTVVTKKFMKQKEKIEFPQFESIDTALGLASYDNDTALYTEVLHNFRAEYYGIYLEMIDESELRATLETLKKHAKNIGALQLFQTIFGYERGYEKAAMTKLYKELHNVIEEIEEKLVE